MGELWVSVFELSCLILMHDEGHKDVTHGWDSTSENTSTLPTWSHTVNGMRSCGDAVLVRLQQESS